MANYCGTTHLSKHIWYPPTFPSHSQPPPHAVTKKSTAVIYFFISLFLSRWLSCKTAIRIVAAHLQLRVGHYKRVFSTYSSVLCPSKLYPLLLYPLHPQHTPAPSSPFIVYLTSPFPSFYHVHDFHGIFNFVSRHERSVTLPSRSSYSPQSTAFFQPFSSFHDKRRIQSFVRRSTVISIDAGLTWRDRNVRAPLYLCVSVCVCCV